MAYLMYYFFSLMARSKRKMVVACSVTSCEIEIVSYQLQPLLSRISSKAANL